jgi:hypothetical protein
MSTWQISVSLGHRLQWILSEFRLLQLTTIMP